MTAIISLVVMTVLHALPTGSVRRVLSPRPHNHVAQIANTLDVHDSLVTGIKMTGSIRRTGHDYAPGSNVEKLEIAAICSGMP